MKKANRYAPIVGVVALAAAVLWLVTPYLLRRELEDLIGVVVLGSILFGFSRWWFARKVG